MVKTSAPGKLMIMGEHSVIYGHPCLVTAVDCRLAVELEQTHSGLLQIEAPDVGLNRYEKAMDDLARQPSKAAEYIEHSLALFLEFNGESLVFSDEGNNDFGLRVRVHSEFSADYGLGSSSALVVALLGALFRSFNVCRTDACGESIFCEDCQQGIFDLGLRTIHRVKGVGSGFDLAAAIYGGTLYFQNEGERCEQLYHSDDEPLSFLIAYSGEKADSATLVKRLAEARKQNLVKYDTLFQSMTEKVELFSRQVGEFSLSQSGAYLTECHHLLQELGVSTFQLDRMVGASIEAGAYGAKLSGAGGGDCIIILAPHSARSSIQKSLEVFGAELLDFNTHAVGLRCE